MTTLDEALTEPSWRARLAPELDRLMPLWTALQAERAAGRRIFPEERNTFRALNLVPYEKVAVVILGQDPYHGLGQAQGLAFSVPEGVTCPPSLRNIRKEIAADLGRAPHVGVDLTPWTAEGVLLLNTTLTVEEGKAGSHAGRGWEAFTDRIVQLLDAHPTPLAFLLWGAPAQKKAAFVDRTRHLVLEAPHPSPLSAHRGFHGCRQFSRVNAWLEQQGRPAIAW